MAPKEGNYSDVGVAKKSLAEDRQKKASKRVIRARRKEKVGEREVGRKC